MASGGLAAFAGSVASPAAAATDATDGQFRRPSNWAAWRGLESSAPYAGHVTSQPDERDLTIDRIEGRLPQDLVGDCLRVGPGVFERGAERKRSVLDADGMVRRYRIRDGRVTFRNRHVRTPKFLAESAAERFLYPTPFLLPNSRSWLDRSAARVANAASIVVQSFAGRLWVADEAQKPFALDPEGLNSLGEFVVDPKTPRAGYLAHSKPDPAGDGHLFVEFAPFRLDVFGSAVQVKRMARDGSVADVGPAVSIDSIVHDWAPTPRFVCFVQHSLKMDPATLASAMLGDRTLAEAMRFQPGAGGQLVIVDRRQGGATIRLPIRPLHFWHVVNAHEEGDRLVVRLAASSSGGPDIGGPGSPYLRLMDGREAWTGAPQNTVLFRIEADVAAKRVVYEGLDRASVDGFEMPTVDPRRLGRNASCFYCMRGQEFLQTRVARVPLGGDPVDEYDFGDGFVSEPLFAPRPGSTADDDGWVLTDVYFSREKTNALAVFDARAIARGPLALARLPFHLPVGFHGTWIPGRPDGRRN